MRQIKFPKLQHPLKSSGKHKNVLIVALEKENSLPVEKTCDIFSNRYLHIIKV